MCKAAHSPKKKCSLTLSVWKGVDTVLVCAGVSALRPLLDVAGVSAKGELATQGGIQHAVDVSNAALRGNYTGPLVSAVTFVRLRPRMASFLRY